MAEDVIMQRPQSTTEKNLKTDTESANKNTQLLKNKVLINVIETLEDEIHKMESEIIVQNETLEENDVVVIDQVQPLENNVEQLEKQEVLAKENTEGSQREKVQKTEDVIVVEDLPSDNISKTVIEIDSCNVEMREEESTKSVRDDKVVDNIASKCIKT